MLKRPIFVYVFLFSYSGAILHGIVPHHHHDSSKEAAKHHQHHHNDQASHSHDDAPKDTNPHDPASSLYFLSHASNADALLTHGEEQGTVSVKNLSKVIARHHSFFIFEVPSLRKVFHPPTDDCFTLNAHFLFRALRAPPHFIG
jgi:hypothetical protein